MGNNNKWCRPAMVAAVAACVSMLGVNTAMAVETVPAATDQTITIDAGAGSTLAGRTFRLYRLAEYPDVVVDGQDVKSISAQPVDNATSAWIKNALDSEHVSVKAGDNPASTLLRLQTDTEVIRRVAANLAANTAGKPVSKTVSSNGQTATVAGLPAGFYLITDADGVPILMSSTINGKDQLNGTGVGKTTIKSNGIRIDKQVKDLAGDWVDNASATNGETREFRALLTVPNPLAVETLTIGDVMVGMEYVDGSFSATIDGKDVTGQFNAATRTANGFTVTSKATLTDQYDGKQLIVAYKAKVTGMSKAVTADNTISATPNWKDGLFEEGRKPPIPTDKATVNTYDLRLSKVSAASDATKVAGAGFKVRNESRNKWMSWNASTKQWSYVDSEAAAGELRTDANGVIDFTSLGAGTYLIKETTVPSGYFSNVRPSLRVTITEDGRISVKGVDQPGLTTALDGVDGKSGTPTVTVRNVNNVSQLPKTGSTTLAILMFGGAAVLLAAGVAGVTAYRMKSRI